MSEEDERIQQLTELLDKQDDKKEKNKGLLVTELPPKYKCVCGKDVEVSELRPINSPVIGKCISDVCKNCKDGVRLHKESAMLVCNSCRRVVRRVAPWTDPRSKFQFLPGHIYHIANCPECTGETREYKVLEMVLWNRKLMTKPK